MNSRRRLTIFLASLESEDIRWYSRIFQKFWNREMAGTLKTDDFTRSLWLIYRNFPELEQKFASSAIPARKLRGGGSGGSGRQRYFFGLGSAAAGCFIGEALKLRCGGKWCRSDEGVFLELPGNCEHFSPVQKLAELRYLKNEDAAGELKEYLFTLAASFYGISEIQHPRSRMSSSNSASQG